MIQTATVAVYPDEGPFASTGEADVSPPREARSTDASKLSFPLQLVIAIVVGCVTIVSGQMILDRGRGDSQAQIQSDVRDILTRMEYEAKMKVMSDKALDARFESLESKIEASGLRNFNMSMAQELSKQKEKP